jgi:organic hydroperoxide reductase OsmC/OhrA
MENLPHTYSAAIIAGPEGAVDVSATGVPGFAAAPPAQFGGPGDIWSPEDLLMASLSSCFVLSFRAIAKLSKLDWHSLEVTAEGELDKVERVMKFTRVKLIARLKIGTNADADKAGRLLQKAESSCFVSSTLNCAIDLDSHIRT